MEQEPAAEAEDARLPPRGSPGASGRLFHTYHATAPGQDLLRKVVSFPGTKKGRASQLFLHGDQMPQACPGFRVISDQGARPTLFTPGLTQTV